MIYNFISDGTKTTILLTDNIKQNWFYRDDITKVYRTKNMFWYFPSQFSIASHYNNIKLAKCIQSRLGWYWQIAKLGFLVAWIWKNMRCSDTVFRFT